MIINSVVSVRSTERPGVFVLTLNITDGAETYECNYVSDPSDVAGINPLLRDWLANNSYDLLPSAEVK